MLDRAVAAAGVALIYIRIDKDRLISMGRDRYIGDIAVMLALTYSPYREIHHPTDLQTMDPPAEADW